ncbi:uncharacterized protein ACLA_034940 [Aspergillus clavatus NRRL 1]|uniref:Uncharacterized protein n=1 Tax=Aspergillus clavatus (strain ATCC 1007 / CBS 513.65 / DSM 816 / NCTC 3887 / NRRL 1 / QM 1276 / 107) TaxID=344612 RepID=A1CJG7_ASPCL|nr:uncharacterized protein ACLA_034940 [Aspergillus clavatus NRRL 1]EAW09291.1 hypothetical protein ACLA_034940 [Aspergillus clavatus NRRL 1]
MTEHTIVIACECSRTTRDLEDTEEKIVMKGIGLTEKDMEVLQRPQIEIGPADTDERMNLAAPMRLTIDLPERNGGGGQPREADRHGASVLMLAIVTDIENAPDRCRDLTLHRQLDMGVGEEGLIIGTERTQKESGYGSDPLEELVGPLPPKQDGLHGSGPIRSRGRGAYRPNASNIDAHFADDYDPTLDVQLEDDNLIESSRPSRRPVAGLMTGDDDWELALEALRDRTRWRQKGEERLREAGCNNAVVDRWKHSSSAPGGDDEGRLEDVKWSKKGEGREWDRGKFVDADGHVDVKASW